MQIYLLNSFSPQVFVSTYYILGNILGPLCRVVNETGKNFFPHRACILLKEPDDQQDKLSKY